jgi:hypothetical protein
LNACFSFSCLRHPLRGRRRQRRWASTSATERSSTTFRQHDMSPNGSQRSGTRSGQRYAPTDSTPGDGNQPATAWDHLLFPCKYASFSLHPYFSVSFSYLPYLTVSYRILPVRCILTRISPYLSVSLRISPYFSLREYSRQFFDASVFLAYLSVSFRILKYACIFTVFYCISIWDTREIRILFGGLRMEKYGKDTCTDTHKIRARYVFFSGD